MEREGERTKYRERENQRKMRGEGGEYCFKYGAVCQSGDVTALDVYPVWTSLT